MAGTNKLGSPGKSGSNKKKKISTEKGRWHGHKFVVSSSMIKPFTDLSIQGSSETEEKEKSEQKHVTRKRGNPTEISMTILLNAFAGCVVREESMAFVDEARLGLSDYLYIGGKKLISSKLMLTNASVQEIQISPGGTWTNAKVSLTFKQTGTGGKSVNDSSSSSGGGSGGGGGGGGAGSAGAGSAKYSVNSSTPKTTNTVTFSSIGNTVKQGASILSQAKEVISGNKTVSEATKYIADMAKKQTAPAKPTIVKSQRLTKMSLTK